MASSRKLGLLRLSASSASATPSIISGGRLWWKQWRLDEGLVTLLKGGDKISAE
jgi:hypothetical protein